MEQINLEEPSEKSRLTAALLALFLGIFGTHRFYIGKPRTALVMLALTIFYSVTVRPWGIIMVIPLAAVELWVLIDFIFIVAGIMKDKENKIIKNWSR
jgi:TM2 domain-containing membrane protein YozV